MSVKRKLTPADLERELIATMRSVLADPRKAVRRFQALRTRALRRKWKSLATSCLVQMRLAGGAYGAWDQELGIARRLVREAPATQYYFWLGGALERNGRLGDALTAYRQAIELASEGDKARECYVQSVERIRKIEEDQ